MNLLGDDIKLVDGDIAFTTGNGDSDTVSGIDCLLQDITEELQFPYCDDPDHPDRGNAIFALHVSEEKYALEKIYIKQEVLSILSRDPRIKKNSISIQVVFGSEISVSFSFVTINCIVVDNLVVPVSQGVLL